MDEKEPNAVEVAFEHLAPLIRAGATPGRMMEAVGQIVSGWAAEPDMDALKAQARIEEMWDSISRDAAGLQEQMADHDAADAQARAAAERVLAAMQAAITALTAAHQRL